MRRIEEFKMQESIRPLFDGFWCDGGGGRLRDDSEYFIKWYLKDAKDRLSHPHSAVILVDGAKMSYCLGYGRYVLGRRDPKPSPEELRNLPVDCWNTKNLEMLKIAIPPQKKLLPEPDPEKKEPEGQIISPRGSSVSFRIDLSKRPQKLAPQASTMLEIFAEAGLDSQVVSTPTLVNLLEKNSKKLNTTQSVSKLLAYYRLTQLREVFTKI